MYKYGAADETDDMLAFDATVDIMQDSSLVDFDDDFLCTRPDGEGILDFKVSRGPTIKSKSNKGKVIVAYNEKGVLIGDEATRLTTFKGMVARTMVPIAYESWRLVGEETKEELWQYVLMNFVVDPKSQKNTLQSIGKKWKNFKHYLYKNKHYLYKNFIQKYKNVEEVKLLNPPKMYPFLKKADWKLFVAQILSKKWEEKSDDAKKIRAKYQYNHRLSRKGYVGLIVEIV
ncbi:hypothetical protein L1887_39124 [Cichorium endivia]|nr:hypothetical protein L1887_39124 [Cichorium endivia]